MAEFKEQMLQLWNNFSSRQRVLLGAGIVAVFVAILGWSYWLGGKADYVPLYTKLEAKDAGDIVARLKEAKIAYQIGDNGSSIMVSPKDVYQVRMDLASQGLPKGKKGFELFEENKFGTTEFQNKVNYLQALQGELARTIEQIQEIDSARVHIVMPEDSLYKKNEKPASASVMLQMKSNAALNKKQVQGIVNLVSHSVQGLRPENITLIDGFAKVLNLPEEENSKEAAEKENNVDTSKMSKFYFNLTREIQSEMQENVQTLLDNSLGEKKAVARVTVELNFDRRLIDKQTFEPTTEDKGILRSSQEVAENYQGGAPPQPIGPPGTTSNIPGYPTANTTQGQSNYERKETTRNYEITETKEKIIQQPVSIKRVTVAVFIDETLTPAQQEGISRVVASAAGFNEARGDMLSVERVPFSISPAEIARQKEIEPMATEQQVIRYATYASPLLLLLLAGAGWFIFSKKQKKEERQATLEREALLRAEREENASSAHLAHLASVSASAAGVHEDEQQLELSMDREVSPEEREVLAKKAAIEEWAAKQPEEFNSTLRRWLSSD